jgi:SAM-dependent methyltransferase
VDLTPSFEPGSYRDRHARVFRQGDSVFRALDQEAFDAWQMLSATRFFKEFSRTKRLVSTQEVRDGTSFFGLPKEWIGVLQHENIPFVSYPYEWSFGMLKDAAILQLELIQEALRDGMTVKDSTPFNIQWEGATPVFIDISSFGPLRPGDPWAGYRQFCQTFLYPLFLHGYKGIPFQTWLRGNLEGIEATNLCKVMGPLDYLRPGVFVHLYLHAKAEERFAGSESDLRTELRDAGFNTQLITTNIQRLMKLVRHLRLPQQNSQWLTYNTTNSYCDADREQKVAFVRRVLESKQWKLVWDFGCNLGTFSRIAAENAQHVVAFDADPLVIENLYQTVKAENNRRVLPLVVDLVNPSPSLGWRGLERMNLPDRGMPDLIICLALIHHLVVGANVPLAEFVDWLASYRSDVLIEFVDRQDPMVRGILRNRDDDYPDYDEDVFRRRFCAVFDLVWSERLNFSRRRLYYGRIKR